MIASGMPTTRRPALDLGGPSSISPVKAATLRSAAPGTARTGLRPWGADPARRAEQRAGIRRSDRLIGSTGGEPGCEPSSSACQCPSRGHRVKGACGVARDRYATLDLPTAHQGSGAYEKDGGEVGTGPVEDQDVTVPKRPGDTATNDLPVLRTHMNSEQSRTPGRGQT
jgi:hypothetical protein